MIFCNVGLVGHVSNGKSTLVKALTGVDTKRFYNEKKHGATIHLGYANAFLYKCPKCFHVWCEGQSQTPEGVSFCCESTLKCIVGLSFVDCPGHHAYVTTMAKGSSLMDAAIIVTDVTQPPEQKQTIEHLVILEALRVSNLIVVQNKCDLINITEAEMKQLKTYHHVTDEQELQRRIDLRNMSECYKHCELLEELIPLEKRQGTPIIPVCANYGMVDGVAENLLKVLKSTIEYKKKQLANMIELVAVKADDSKEEVDGKKSKFKKNFFSIIRSFDVNLPGTDIDKMKGGVLGGSVVSGIFKKGDRIEIRPGRFDHVLQEWIPLKTRITSIRSETIELPCITNGGLYAIGTTLDPSLTKKDGLVGHYVGLDVGDLPHPLLSIQFQFHPLSRYASEKLDNHNTVKTGLKKSQKTLLSSSTTTMTTTTREINKHDKLYLLSSNSVLHAECTLSTITKSSLSTSSIKKERLVSANLSTPICVLDDKQSILVYSSEQTLIGYGSFHFGA